MPPVTGYGQRLHPPGRAAGRDGAWAVEAHGLTKRFGHTIAVDDVELLVPRGSAFGYLGPNGAGKTTLIRVLLGLTRASGGTMSLLGIPVPSQRRAALARVGAIVDEPRFHGHLSGRENLLLLAAARGNGASLRIGPALERVGLAGRADDRVATYSMGMRQRLGLAACLLGDPELLILDEPMNGLDPAGMHEMRDMIRDLAAEGRTVMLSSHLLDEVERTCDHVAIVDRGRVIRQGPIRELTSDTTTALRIQCEDPPRAARVLTQAGIAVPVTVEADGLAVTLPVGAARETAAGISSRHGQRRMAAGEQHPHRRGHLGGLHPRARGYPGGLGDRLVVGEDALLLLLGQGGPRLRVVERGRAAVMDQQQVVHQGPPRDRRGRSQDKRAPANSTPVTGRAGVDSAALRLSHPAKAAKHRKEPHVMSTYPNLIEGVPMTSIESVTLEVPDPGAAEAFYTAAFGLGDKVRVRASHSPKTGFRGFTLSLVVCQPSTVDSLISTALAGGATTLKPAKKQFWGGYSAVVRAPDGTIWKVATSAKKDTGPAATRAIDGIVLILGVADMARSKQFYAGHGLAVAKSFGSKYAEFDAEAGAIKLSLYKRSGLAKDAAVSPEGTGSHRPAIGSHAGPFTDPDGVTWEAA